MSENYQQDKMHEKLIELLWKVKGMGKIGEAIIRSVKETVNSEEKILTCFYTLVLSEQIKTKEGLPTFYSCEIHLVTTLNYIILGFYPNFHSATIKQIHNISDLRIENRFESDFEEEQVPAEERNYDPSLIILTVNFVDQFGKNVAEWIAEGSTTDSKQLLLDQAKVLSKLVGKPLNA
jgi:hypothetical protein